MAILTTADYDEVRAALSLDIDANDLPDSVIGRDVYQGAAEREVLVLAPNAMNYAPGSPEWDHVRVAAIFFTAARLALRLTRVSSERIASWSASYLTMDPEQLAASLRAQAMAELGAIAGVLQDLTTTIAPRTMTLASGGRGDVRPRCSWLTGWW